MTTARDLVQKAHKKISVLGQGSTLTSEEINDGFDEMNAMIAQWSTDGALIFTETKETFSLSGATSYTIGSGQTFDTTLPRDIKAAYVSENGFDTPLDLIDNVEYASISDKDQTGTPEKIYFDGNYPTGNIYIWPVGYSYTTLTMFTEKPLTSFSSLTTTFEMPLEYETAIIYNLAVRLAPDYEKEASQTVKTIAKDSLAAVSRQNKKNNNNKVAVDSAFLGSGTYDINTGQVR